jgi:hypothetical protein
MWTPQPHPQDHNLILLLLVHGSMTAGAHCRRRRGQPSRVARSSALPTRATLSAGACRMLRRPAPPRANRPAPLAPPPRCFAQLAPLTCRMLHRPTLPAPPAGISPSRGCRTLHYPAPPIPPAEISPSTGTPHFVGARPLPGRPLLDWAAGPTGGRCRRGLV